MAVGYPAASASVIAEMAIGPVTCMPPLIWSSV